MNEELYVQHDYVFTKEINKIFTNANKIFDVCLFNGLSIIKSMLFGT